MYSLYVQPFKCPLYIYLGNVCINNIDEILELIKNYIEYELIDNINAKTIATKYADNKFAKISIRDCYDNDKEIYSAIYDMENKSFKEV